MKTWLLAAAMATVTAMFVPLEAEAKRLGGGKSTGMQREMPARQSADTPAKPATPTQTTPTATAAGAAAPAAAAAAAKPRPAWLAPVAGLAAGLGIAALASSLGFGEELANILTIALLAMAAVFVVRLLMRRGSAQGGARLATAGAAAGGGHAQPSPNAWTSSAPAAQPMAREMTSAAASFGAAPVSSAAATLPADFDAAGFERIAKMIFIRMQAAHDAGDLNDLRQFTTPEMFASIRLDLQDRGAAPNHTDVEQVDAQVLDVAQEDERQIVSVRFHGLIREQQGADAEAFDEVWHLVKPGDGNWAIAGIQQRH